MAPTSIALVTQLQTGLAAHGVTGAALAVLRDGAVEIAAAGVKDIETGAPVDVQTVFDVASLSKPMVAYAALQLADAGVLDLDAPVCQYAQRIVPEDPASTRITARHLLAHSCGLQNLRAKDAPLHMYFEPGTRFSYSSVGFNYLQAALAACTGEPLEATMQRLVFGPLGMATSSFEWQARFASNVAHPHEANRRMDKHHPPAASASYSLQTTAGDYALFVAAVLRGQGLQASTQRQWLTCGAHVPQGAAIDLAPTPGATEADVGWGLGWGIEPSLGTFFQWGKMDGVRAFVMGSVAEQAAVVLLTNSNTGLRLLRDVTREVLPGEHAAIAWLACVTE